MGAKIIFPDDVLQAIIKDYKEGVYADKILEEYGLSMNVLYRILTENNVSRRLFNKTDFPESLVKAVTEDYQLGVEQCELKLKHGINKYFIKRILLENNIRIRDRARVIPEDVKQLILNDYQLGLGFKRIYQKYKVGQDPLDKLLTENNITRHQKHGSGNNRHEFNFNFFNEDTPLTAYWAGFIMADGCISKATSATPGASHKLSISIGKLDTAHLQQFLVDIKYCMADVPLEPNSLNQQVRATVTHPLLISSLKRWGVVPRKSYNFVEPDVPEELLRHYLLGWFDGDGHLRTAKHSEVFQVTGNPEALQWYSRALQQLGFNGKIQIWQAPNQKWARLAVAGAEQVKTVINLFFPSVTFCLNRKWDKALQLDRSPLNTCKICTKSLYRRNRTNVCAYCQRLIPFQLRKIIYTSGWDDSYKALLPTELINKSTIVSTSDIEAPLLANFSTI